MPYIEQLLLNDCMFYPLNPQTLCPVISCDIMWHHGNYYFWCALVGIIWKAEGSDNTLNLAQNRPSVTIIYHMTGINSLICLLIISSISGHLKLIVGMDFLTPDTPPGLFSDCVWSSLMESHLPELGIWAKCFQSTISWHKHGILLQLAINGMWGPSLFFLSTRTHTS